MRILFFVLCSFIAGTLNSFGQTKDIYSRIDAAADKIEAKAIAWRRDIHEHPELSNHEFRTSKIVADHLRSLGLEVKEGVANTGVVGILRGGKPGPVIALRADMDALPIVERTNVPFASKVKSTYEGQEVGVMHACGHDAHTAILMSVAEILSSFKNDLRGTVKFIFQPAEEGVPGDEKVGAAEMINENVLDSPKVDVIFGLHTSSNTEVGKLKYRSGGMMASSDWFTIKVKGRGSHGAQPWNSIDPVVTAAQIINGLQTIVSRRLNLTKDPAVISVCAIKGGFRNNVIPEEVELKGTIRSLDKEMRKEIWDKIKLTATKIAESDGATADVIIQSKTAITYNDPALVKKMLPSMQKTVGESNVEWTDVVTVSEDFSYFQEKVPGFFFFLGAMPKGADPAKAPDHHTPDFYIDEGCIKIGIKTFCRMVIDYMK